MSNYTVRDNFKDIFGVYFLESLSFEGDYDMPIVGNFDDISVIDYIALYSDTSEYNKTENTCVAFYQYDHVFDGIHGLYNSIIYQDEERLNKFRERFKGVKYIVAPDYSLFGDFPNALQIFNIYKSRVCMCWLIANTKAKILPNVRWTFPFTFEYCFDGIMKGSNIAIGVLGQIRDKENKKMFLDGLKVAIDRIEPKRILVYGFVTESNFNEFLGTPNLKESRLLFLIQKSIDIRRRTPFMGQGKTFSSGISGKGLGTKGGKAALKDKIDGIINKDPLLKQLVDSKVKISVKDVVFTAKDSSGQVVWLEKGNATAGFNHIMKHENDFVAKHNIQKGRLPSHLKNVVSKGKVINSSPVKLPNGKYGLEKIYLYKGKYYTLGAIGTNGFIVSMYPLDGGK